MIKPSLVPRHFEGRRKGLVHTVCACSVPLLKNHRGLDVTVYLSIHKSAYVSMFFVAGHLPFEPHSDSVFTPRACARGKVISSVIVVIVVVVVVVVSTKIVKSQKVGA